MKKIKILPLIIIIAILFSACSLSIPDDLSYTQASDPKTGSLKEDNSVVHEPTGDTKGKIFIDPGHGFSDPGTLAPNYETSKVSESFTVYDICVRVMQILVNEGYEVMLSREADYDIRQETEVYKIQPEERADMANNWGADLLLSLHINAFEDDPTINSILCCYTTKESPSDELMEQYANSLLNNFIKSIGDRPVSIEKNEKKNGFWVNSAANMPSILMEIGFITNEDDVKNFESEEWRQKAAEGLAKGIIEFAGSAEYSEYKKVS